MKPQSLPHTCHEPWPIVWEKQEIYQSNVPSNVLSTHKAHWGPRQTKQLTLQKQSSEMQNISLTIHLVCFLTHLVCNLCLQLPFISGAEACTINGNNLVLNSWNLSANLWIHVEGADAQHIHTGTRENFLSATVNFCNFSNFSKSMINKNNLN
jgi:hypothetical protein